MPGYELFGEDEFRAVKELFEANNGILFAHGFGNVRNNIFRVREFEAAISKTAGSPYCQVVSSGTAALLIAIRALGVKPGDEVITSSFTFVATVEAILEAGATPVLTEIDETYNMDIDDLQTKITPKTKLILPVHMAGASARMDEIKAVAKENNLKVLEDTAQAFGGTYKGKTLGTIGDAGIFSFDFGKNLTTGEGGAIVSASEEIFNRSRELHDHGHQYNPTVPRGRDTRRMRGFNYRMTEIQAAIGLAQLAKVDRINEAQRRNKKKLLERLAGLDVEFRKVIDDGEIADTLIFALDSKDIALKVVDQLAQDGVGTKNLPDAIDWHFAGTWNHMFHDVPSLQNCAELWPKTRDLLARSIALPVNVKMTDEEIDRVANTVRQAVTKTRS